MTKERLTQAEENALVTDAQEHANTPRGARALKRLVEHNVGLVHKIVNKVRVSATCPYDDLVQEGVMGLMHGISKFEPERGNRLSTYVYSWIFAYVRKFYLNNCRTVRLPVHVNNRYSELQKSIEDLTRDLGRLPSTAEICENFDGADTVMCQAMFSLSLNSLLSEDGELQDVVADEHVDNHAQLDVDLMLARLQQVCSERDFNVLVHRYGLDGGGERTLSELSTEFNVSRARCHQVCNNMLNKLRHMA